jgi:putative FmdB family regulatory protein
MMPIFEYKCVSCGKVAEFLEKTNAKNDKVCRNCGGKMVKQLSVFSAKVKEGDSKRCTSCGDGQCPYVG